MEEKEMMLHEDRYAELRERYRRFYGRVAEDQNRTILEHVSGKSLLEVGCGYGHFVWQVSKCLHSVGADYDIKALQTGRQEFGVNLVLSDSYQLSFPDSSFDTIVLRETAHHLEFERALPELDRVTCGEIVIFDPNPVFIVRMARKLIGHKDYEAQLPELVRVLEKFGYSITRVSFRDVFAFPASGGLVGPELIPHVEWLERLILSTDHCVNSVLRFLGLQKYFCWRYIIQATKVAK